MSPIDIVILVLAVITIVCISYFAIWKNRNKGCKNCPYAKNCEGSCNSKQEKQK